MRASTNGISSVRFAFGCQAASWRTCSSVTFLPSQFLSTDSSTMRIDTGSLSSFGFSAFPSIGSEYSLPCLKLCRVLCRLCRIAVSITFFQFIQKARALFQQCRELLVAARDRRRIVADFLRQLGNPPFEVGTHGTNRSTNSLTGVFSSRPGSAQSSSIVFCCSAGKRRARLVLNFSTRIGMPSLRRRRWPIGYSQTTSSSLLPALNSTVSALAIERFFGSWQSRAQRLS